MNKKTSAIIWGFLVIIVVPFCLGLNLNLGLGVISLLLTTKLIKGYYERKQR